MLAKGHAITRRYASLAGVIVAAATVALWWSTPLDAYPALLTAASVVTFAAYGWDKRAAASHRERVPEVVLHALALAGGFAGGWLGRSLFRHKTRKPSFTLVLAAATLAHGAFITWRLT